MGVVAVRLELSYYGHEFSTATCCSLQWPEEVAVDDWAKAPTSITVVANPFAQIISEDI